jgi:hypothetical protein
MAGAVDVGDLCVFCGLSTSFGTGRYVNRIPAGSYPRDQVAASLAAAHPGAKSFDGWYCSECQSSDCEACQAERKDSHFDAGRYIGQTGFLCDDHTSVVDCVVCHAEIEEGQKFVVGNGGWELRHASCPV